MGNPRWGGLVLDTRTDTIFAGLGKFETVVPFWLSASKGDNLGYVVCIVIA